MAINALGIGSGVLTADVLDQLREADENTLLNPLDARIVASKTKIASLTSIETLLNAFKTSVNSLNDDTLFTKRSVTLSDSGISVTADDGIDPQSFKLETTTLATQAVMESSVSGVFTSGSSKVSQDGSGGTYDITVDGTTYNVTYTGTTTLDELVSEINTVAGSAVTASAIQVGTDDYRLVLKSNETGSTQGITTADSGTGLDGAGLTDADTVSAITQVQAAGDAQFIYNDVPITRASNEITDLITGVTITLEEAGKTNTVTIAQDTDSVVSKMEGFVTTFNSLVTHLGNLTKAGGEGQAAGVFSSDSFVKSIERELDNLISARSAENTSLIDYGLAFDKEGKLSLDASTLRDKLETDPSGTQLALTGDLTTDGIFDTLENTLDGYMKYQGLFDSYAAGLDSNLANIESQRERTVQMLETRYSIMAKRFTAYDAMISKLNASFSMLEQQIAAAINAKN